MPSPPGQFAHYHDHWLGLVALALGEIECVDRPLCHYVQHGHAALGHEAANRVTPLRARLARLREDLRERVRINSARYFRDVMRLQAWASVLESRFGRDMNDEQREALELALQHAVDEGAFRNWELRGIGSLGRGRRIQLEDGPGLELLARRPQADYGSMLAEHDVGLALMYTPHPSLVPIEMAAAGMLTVTNTFEHKISEALRAISTYLIAGEPTIDGIASALHDAAAGVDDVRRIEGSAVNWSRDWRDAFDDQLLAGIESRLFPT